MGRGTDPTGDVSIKQMQANRSEKLMAGIVVGTRC